MKGKKLKTIREFNGLTQEELSDKVGISQKRISQMETDLKHPPSENELKLFSKLYNIPFEFLNSDEALTLNFHNNHTVNGVFGQNQHYYKSENKHLAATLKEAQTRIDKLEKMLETEKHHFQKERNAAQKK